MSCKCQCQSNNSCGYGYPNVLGGLSCKTVTPLLLLILFALQFGKCNDHDHDDPCHHESGCKIDNSVLFIIALFLLLSCGCGCSGTSNYNNGCGC